MAFYFIRSPVRTKDVLSCLRNTLQTQNILYSQRQNLKFNAEKLLTSQQRCFALLSNPPCKIQCVQQRCFASLSNSQCKIQFVYVGTGCRVPGLRLRMCGLNKAFTRFSSTGNKSDKKNLTAALYIASFGIFMLGAAYLGIPLYRMFCQAFGVGGESAYTAKIIEKTEKIQTMKKIEDRIFTVIFSADTAATMKWDFKPQQREVKIAPGETALAFYTAKNPTDKPIVGISTYSVLPNKAAPYFNKIQCFCFEEQILNPHEQVDMPVFFYIDPDIDDDIYLEDLEQIILSYTFFEAKEGVTLPLPGFPEQKPNANPA